jgi:threonine/homoserine/homoserine lactone efflux protein
VSEYLLVGIGFSFAAAVQPGPLQAFLLSTTAAHGWKRTLPAAFSPLLSDGPIAIVVLLVLGQVPAGFAGVVQMAGGVLLVYLAARAFSEWRRAEGGATVASTQVPRTLLQATGVNLLNPNPYLGWSLVLGPLFLKAWRDAPQNGVALLVAFYGTMVASLAAIIIVFGTLRALGPRVVRVLLLVSAIMLGALGGYQISAGLWRLAA